MSVNDERELDPYEHDPDWADVLLAHAAADYGNAPSPSAARLRRELNNDATGTCMVCGADASMVCDEVVHRPKPTNAPNPKQAQGDKKIPVWCVPPALVLGAAKALGEGVIKYGAFNWRTSKVEVMTYVAALARHGYAFADGEDVDPESPTGKLHLEGMAACIAILLDAWYGGFLIDNRPPKGPAPEMTRAPITKPAPLPLGVVNMGYPVRTVRAGELLHAHDFVPQQDTELRNGNGRTYLEECLAQDDTRRLAAEERLRANQTTLTPSLPQLPGHHDPKE